MPRFILLGVLVCLAACTAPQGKKLAMNDGLAPVASGPSTGPATGAATLSLQNRGEMVSVYTNGTVTLKLPSYNRDGYEWRFTEVPDPTVLKLVSQEFTPGAEWTKAGEQTMVFQAVGPGEVGVKMWYGTIWASRMDSAQPFDFLVSVSPEPPPVKKSKKRSNES